MNKYTSTNSIVLGSQTLITDPCYDKDNSTGGMVSCDTLPGRYVVKEIIQKTPGEYDMLEGVLIVHESQKYELAEGSCTDRLDVAFVDSGELGVYDIEKYPDMGIEIDERAANENKLIYRLPDGIWGVTISGFGGDGEYPVFVHKNADNKVDAIYINFNEE